MTGALDGGGARAGAPVDDRVHVSHTLAALARVRDGGPHLFVSATVGEGEEESLVLLTPSLVHIVPVVRRDGAGARRGAARGCRRIGCCWLLLPVVRAYAAGA